MADRFQSPNAKYLFGTDEFGRDLFARILYGGRISMFASLAVIGIAFVIGAIMGGFKIIFKELAPKHLAASTYSTFRSVSTEARTVRAKRVCLAVMAVNFIGDGLRDAFDPKTKN